MGMVGAKKGYKEIKTAGYRIVTSDYVLDEVITALFANVAFSSAVHFVESLFDAIKGNQINLERITETRFKAAWSLRKKFQDKPDISFTDFTSFILMQELMINKVFTGDVHFKQINKIIAKNMRSAGCPHSEHGARGWIQQDIFEAEN